jgi:hypothetical protein
MDSNEYNTSLMPSYVLFDNKILALQEPLIICLFDLIL